jgi:serine/threonine-protein kinase
MTDDPRVQQLLEELLDSHATPEEVCASCPELLPVVRDRWRQMRRLRADLDALFPPPDAPSTKPNALFPPPPEPPPRPPEGTALPRIPGYEVEGVLGRGGMGIVFRARHLRLNRLVALKMALAGAYAEPRERGRFQQEMEAEAGLRHPNIVQVHDVGEHDGRPYFTMELVEGGSLAQKLQGTPQPGRQAATLVATLAGAMQVAHQGGVVHRDLKPANVLLTADGTPKIADFGLARRLEGGAGLTQTGVPVGTPSYMAPEQARGHTHGIGPAVDVYALGAILYELLTGRPPFRAETAAETVLQVISQEPAPPSRLNAKVPRDLETICLKCLHKDPQRRYATAAALADDLQRFLRGEPIAARPAGLAERLGKWVRRRPGRAALLAASLLLAAALVGVSWWLVAERAYEREAVEADLREAAEQRDSARWEEARAVLDRAGGRLGRSGPNDLVRRLGQARRDLDLVRQLNAIRLKRVTRGELAFYKARANEAYAEAFRQAGLGTVGDPPSRMAADINASAVRGALAAALYDWAVCAADKTQRGWLLEVARQTNADSDAWRERVLEPAVWEDPQALADLAQTAPVPGESVSLLLAVGEQLNVVGRDSSPLLKRVQKEHPADFWANLILGNVMLQRVPEEAGGYYRAALASRPGEAVGYCAVGDALRLQNALDEAIDYYEKARRLDPTYARAYSNLGLPLQAQGRLDEAIDAYRKALQLDPDYAWAHHNLANALRDKGRLDEAYDQYQQALRLDPKNAEVQNGARSVLMRQGRSDEVLAGWRKALEANPPEHDAWFGYAELCLFLGQQEEYHRARRALLDRFGATTDPYVAERVGRTCLLVPATGDELRKGDALTGRAVAARGSTPARVYPYFRFARGLAEYRLGHWASASAIMEHEAAKVMGPSPRLVVAMAQHDQGQKKEARATLARAVVSFDWSAAQADNRDAWICHILRREAEAKILPNLPAFLQGEYQPRDNDERLALLGVCQSEGRNAAAAQLYAEVFATDRALADSIPECRSRAARCAALAGCGRGADGATLSEAERAHWRKQAREWLRADLAGLASWLDGAPGPRRGVVRQALTRWRENPDLACLREPDVLDKLAADERRECLALWAEVAAVLARIEK